ncbi:MAG TPA: hypothetical protein VN643_21875 [Pyrinomonadaceae bacterium]|nr:hypothetical protein [Pyrinomonadaceae bacterium]
MKIQLTLLLLMIVFSVSTAAAADTSYLYKATLVQAAPGRILEAIDLYKAAIAQSKDEPPLWMRHSQGDHWDLLLLFPVKSYDEYYSRELIARRKPEQAAWSKINDAIAWQEDVFVYGPSPDELRKAFAASSFFHVEMFHALAGKQSELIKEREMENAYLKVLKRPENFIFVRDQGAAWEVFTIGAYRDLKHFAESANIPEADQEAAAKAAGFPAANRIGPYLRTLIASHHDTLAVAVK